jgi:pantoate kinase
MRARAPASLTGLFVPAVDDAPARGASVALADGVVVDVTPASESTVRVDGDPASFAPVENVLAALDVAATVDVTTEVPLGAGFGASGAATLATALAANEAFDRGLSREACLQAAHRAELDAGTGQGDVFVQAQGGLVYTAGGEHGRVDPDAAVEWASHGAIGTSDLLADEAFLESAREAGERELAALPVPPTVRDLAAGSWRFVDATDLATDRVAAAVQRVREAGGAAGMALFGETTFAVGVDGVLPERTTVETDGARVL